MSFNAGPLPLVQYPCKKSLALTQNLPIINAKHK